MNTTELIARVRLNCFFSSASHPDYTDAAIMDELWDQENELFGRNIINARSGYWLTYIDRALLTSDPVPGSVRLHPRGASGTFESAAISYQAPDLWIPMSALTETEVPMYDLPTGQLGTPFHYVPRGDQLQLVPVPNASALKVRIKFYRRPNKLVIAQDGFAGTTRRGQVLSTTGSTQITMNSLPFDPNTGIAITGTQRFDVIRGGAAGNWADVIFSGIANFSGTTITLSGVFSDDLPQFAAILPGDFVRLGDTSEWPQLPVDFHRALADATSIKILTQLGLDQKAASIATQLAADLNRFQDVITPRGKDGAKDIVAPHGLYRGNARGWVVKFP